MVVGIPSGNGDGGHVGGTIVSDVTCVMSVNILIVYEYGYANNEKCNSVSHCTIQPCIAVSTITYSSIKENGEG